MTEYVKVAEFVRGVVDGKVIVRRPGARIPVALAVQLGVIVDAPMPEPAAAGPRDSSPARRPRRPQGASPPRKPRPRKRR